MEFQSYNSKSNNIHLKTETNVIQNVDSTVFLGITIDKFCNWKPHIQYLCSKLDRFVYVLYRLRQTTTKEAALSAYHGYVSSSIRYGIILWGYSVEADRVFLTQKRCIRSVCGAGVIDSCVPLFKSLKILPVPSLYIYEISIFVKKYPYLFKKHCDVVKRSCRNLNKLYVPPQRLQLNSQNVYCMAIRIYNKVPDKFKEDGLNLFKRKLFNLLLTKCYYSVKDFLNDNNIINK